MIFRYIYCDMDQVIVNFLGGARAVLGKEFNDSTLGDFESKWQKINNHPNFWFDLEWMPNAKLLWAKLEFNNPCVLSACPPVDLNPRCATEKQSWCEKHLQIPIQKCILFHDRQDKA